MKPRKSFLLRLDPLLFRELEAWAADDLRSVNAQIEFLLADAVKRRGKKLPPPTEMTPEPKSDTP